MSDNEKYLLKVNHLKQYFPVRQGFKTIPLKAVDDISFAVKPGETLGLVGESGCGNPRVQGGIGILEYHLHLLAVRQHVHVNLFPKGWLAVRPQHHFPLFIILFPTVKKHIPIKLNAPCRGLIQPQKRPSYCCFPTARLPYKP